MSRCGQDMTVDNHRKVPLKMCYECGYIEGRNVSSTEGDVTNFAHSRSLNINELASFLANGLELDRGKVIRWLTDEYEN